MSILEKTIIALMGVIIVGAIMFEVSEKAKLFINILVNIVNGALL